MRNTTEKQPVSHENAKPEQSRKETARTERNRNQLEVETMHQSPVFYWGGPHFLYPTVYRRK